MIQAYTLFGRQGAESKPCGHQRAHSSERAVACFQARTERWQDCFALLDLECSAEQIEAADKAEARRDR